jgi:K+-transporting ATPase ATPase C chain
MARLWAHFRAALVLLAAFSLLLGAVYPLLVTAGAQLLFPSAANGSLVERHGVIVGSLYLGQNFSRPEYFWGRESATSPAYHPASSAGSNLSPRNPALHERITQRIDRLTSFPHESGVRIPVDLISASASGLDPHISVEAALFQVARVAKARKKSDEEIRALVAAHRQQGIGILYGTPRVNVLALNMALDESAAAAPKEKR